MTKQRVLRRAGGLLLMCVLLVVLAVPALASGDSNGAGFLRL